MARFVDGLSQLPSPAGARWRRLLVAWGCFTGWAISFIGYGNFRAVEHPDTWATLTKLTSPLSSVIATVGDHAVLAVSIALPLSLVVLYRQA